ncbi:protein DETOXIFICATION 45, chloroplastic-like isoform X2 [Magnolia sinica]|uniref:protein DETOXIFICATION 45, chloroplastic-like isoform X2 n=1 Tax=Magnolia sinica TaxID=86752 RepID=UPI002659C6DA|nr:protein DETOXIFICATION 45, chloroplastic-like isoform X2 [Magnolia sinica]
MEVMQIQSSLSNGLATNMCEGKAKKKMTGSFATQPLVESNSLTLTSKSGINAANVIRHSHLSNECLNSKLFFSTETACRKRVLHVINCHSSSSYGIDAHDAEDRFTPKKSHLLGILIKYITELLGGGPGPGSVKVEVLMLALPAIAGQVVEPLAQLMETAYIGRLGPVELASAGVSVSIFNIISKLFNIPLLSITTSFVAEDLSRNASRESITDRGFLEENNERKSHFDDIMERKQLPSVSTALLLASGIGIIEALAMYFRAGMFINMMGISSASPMFSPAQQFLSLRALGAPAVVVSLATQGIFRGFKDTKTPLFCVGVGNLSSIFLLPVLVYFFRLGITGAAIATVSSQYIMTFLLIWFLKKKAVLLPPKMENLQFAGYIRSGGFLLGRTLSVLITMTLGTSMAARQGPLAMAAHQICLQVWLAVSLLSDALALSSQALISSSYSKGDFKRVKEITFFVLKTGLFTGVCLAIILSAWFGSFAELFTKDMDVLQIVKSGVLFVSASQPINALAFVFDGLHYGVSDFSYSAFSMMLVGAVSSAFLFFVPSVFGLKGVWAGLALFMSLRMAAGIMRLASKTGPWWFLHDSQKTQQDLLFSNFQHESC